MQGIDVSSVQGSVDWARVRDDGVDFAVIKATQGRGEGALTRMLRHFRDSRFAANVVGASDAGVDVSVYHYFTATDDAKAAEEAEYFLGAVEPYHGRIGGYAAVDVESEYLKGLTPARLAELVDVFCQRVYAAGFQPLVYTNPDFLVYRFPASFRAQHDIWLAHWGVQRPYAVPSLIMWQYGAGSVDGIAGPVDLDVGYYDVRQVRPAYQIGGRYTIKLGDRYTTGRDVPSRLAGRTYEILAVQPDRLLLGGIMSWIKI